MISKFLSSISVYTNIEVFTDIEAINFDIGIYRYRSFDFDIEVSTSISVYTDIEDFDIGNFDH